MKVFFVLFAFTTCTFSWSDTVWERDNNLVCVETSSDLDKIKLSLNQKFGKDCVYLRDSTRIVIGNIFKCPDDKTYPYFRTKEHCEMFFSEAKKDLLKFAPAGALDAKKWVREFGICMEKASPAQINSMGLQTLNNFCRCVALKTVDKVTGRIVEECSKGLK
jgi:hypothetical protein